MDLSCSAVGFLLLNLGVFKVFLNSTISIITCFHSEAQFREYECEAL